MLHAYPNATSQPPGRRATRAGRGVMTETWSRDYPGVDPLREGDHPLPQRLRGGVIILRQVRIGEQVAPASLTASPRGPTSSSTSTQGTSTA